MSKPIAFILVGLPASGKSTWIGEVDRENAVVLSTDDYIEARAAEDGTTYNGAFLSYIKAAHAALESDFRAAISAQKTIYWDQMNHTVAKRKKILTMLPPNYIRIAIVFKTPEKDEWERRLFSRAGKTIPAAVLSAKVEYPTYKEGFHLICDKEDLDD